MKFQWLTLTQKLQNSQLATWRAKNLSKTMPKTSFSWRFSRKSPSNRRFEAGYVVMVEVKQLVSSEPLQVSMQICSQARGKL